MNKFLIIGSGGAIGSILRYLVVTGVMALIEKHKGPSGFPFGTLAVNIIGCFVIGFLGGLVEYRHWFSPETRMFLFVGVLGGFTTFSTFGYEALNLAREGAAAATITYVLSQVGVGILCAWGGHALSRYV